VLGSYVSRNKNKGKEDNVRKKARHRANKKEWSPCTIFPSPWCPLIRLTKSQCRHFFNEPMARCSQNGENLTTLDLEFRARKQSIPGPRTGTTLLGHIAGVTGARRRGEREIDQPPKARHGGRSRVSSRIFLLLGAMRPLSSNRGEEPEISRQDPYRTEGEVVGFMDFTCDLKDLERARRPRVCAESASRGLEFGGFRFRPRGSVGEK
jgi:hypothetical protein